MSAEKHGRSFQELPFMHWFSQIAIILSLSDPFVSNAFREHALSTYEHTFFLILINESVEHLNTPFPSLRLKENEVFKTLATMHAALVIHVP